MCVLPRLQRLGMAYQSLHDEQTANVTILYVDGTRRYAKDRSRIDRSRQLLDVDPRLQQSRMDLAINSVSFLAQDELIKCLSKYPSDYAEPLNAPKYFLRIGRWHSQHFNQQLQMFLPQRSH